MNQTTIILRDHPEWKDRAATWFHKKWGIPEEAYLESMEECQNKQNGVPQWYIVEDKGRILAGLGVIENDFHKRKDLAPNICAVYVEEDCRKQGLAKYLLDLACEDLYAFGIGETYLLTGHTSFYERCGWEFFCMVEENSGNSARCYRKIHKNG